MIELAYYSRMGYQGLEKLLFDPDTRTFWYGFVKHFTDPDWLIEECSLEEAVEYLYLFTDLTEPEAHFKCYELAIYGRVKE